MSQAGAGTAETRATQLAAGPPGLSRRTLWIGIAVFAVLGVGGALADQSFNVPPTPAPTTAVARSSPLATSLAAFLGLRDVGSRPAPPLRLEMADGAPFSLRREAGRVVLLGFLGGGCGGACGVVSAEVRLAERELARTGVSPAVVVVNADPRLATQGAPGRGAAGQGAGVPAAGAGVLRALPGATFLDGSLQALQQAWTSYGVTVELDPASGALAYTEVLYLVDPAGRLRYSVAPFANESLAGRASLPAPELRRFAGGIARYLRTLAR